MTEIQPRRISTASRIRLAVLPLPRLWWLWALVFAAVTYGLGYGVTELQPPVPGEMAINQAFSEAHTPVLDGIGLAIDWLLNPVQAILLVLLIMAVLTFAYRSPVNAVCFGWVVGLSWLCNDIFKAIIARPRPDPSLLANPLLPAGGNTSFPSGHTSFACALAIGAWLLARGTQYQRLVAVGGVIFTVIVAVSRVYVGVHYPSDVLGAIPATFAGALVAIAAWNGILARFFPGTVRVSQTFYQ